MAEIRVSAPLSSISRTDLTNPSFPRIRQSCFRQIGQTMPGVRSLKKFESSPAVSFSGIGFMSGALGSCMDLTMLPLSSVYPTCYAFAVRSSGRGIGVPNVRRIAADSGFSYASKSPYGRACRLPSGRPALTPVRQPASPAHPIGVGGRDESPCKETAMSNLQTVSVLPSLSLRFYSEAGKFWFAASDIAKGIGHSNPSKMISVLRDSERSNLKLDRGGSLAVISESGLYFVLLRSDSALKEGTPAFDFRVKVTDEILPAIRKTGSYSVTLSPADQLKIRQAISARAKKSAIAYQTLYHALYARFQVAKYDQIKSADLQDALDFIATCDVKLPVLEDKGSITLSRMEMESIRGFVYYKKYLFRKSLDLAYRFLEVAHSPEAPIFYDMIHEMDFCGVERVLDSHGMSIKDMPCYQHWIAAK